MIRSLVTSAATVSLIFASAPAQAAVRPAPTAFAIMINDDFVEPEPVGWLWAGIGVLTTLGLLVLMSGGEESSVGGNSPT